MNFIKRNLKNQNYKNNFKFEFISKCQICNSKKITPFYSFGYHPTVNDFALTNSFNPKVNYFPLDLILCKNCDLIQLNIIINSKTIFPDNYAYRSGTTKILIENFKNLKKNVLKKNILHKKDLVIDIGSNDGTLLENFKDYNILGIEPTNVSKIANKNGIKTIKKPFSYDLSKIIVKKYGYAKLITATNVFAHIENVHSIMKAIQKLLKKDGVFISENHYFFDLIKTLQYDTVYHEHLRYYSLRSLSKLFISYNMEIIDVQKINTHGGSIRVYTAYKNNYKISKNVKKLLNLEPYGNKLNKIIKNFTLRVNRSKLQINNILYQKKLKGKKIVGISAPSRSSTLINFLGLDHNIIDYICEIEGSLKIGKNIPGTQIPVVNEKILFKDQPDFAIIFSWHIYKELTSKIKKKGFRGKFIIPLPKPKII
tara:strand:+ start:3602 stop:4876 length:1275 start_codon:yes stop_codon:yes gene_type:complete